MWLSTKGRYGVRAMFDLAMHSQDGTIALKSVARRENISQKYLEHLFASLRKAGLIQSVRGAQGGYRLGRPASEITLGDIIRVLEGSVSPTECMVSSNETELCERAPNCAMHLVWDRIRQEVNEVLDSYTLADICEEQRKRQNNGYMFYI